jgi:GntR family transcriptional regulator
VTGRPAEPAYRLVARELRAAILQGRYADGAQLPTDAELADRHRLSRQTVRRAFQDLVAEGMVDRIPGRGTFVAERDGQYLRQFGSIDDLMGLSVDTRLEVLAPLRRRVDVDAAGRLHLDADVVHSTEFRRFHDSTPFCLTTVHLPPHIAALLDGTPELATAGSRTSDTVIGLLDERLPSPIDLAEQSITAVTAAVNVHEALGCPVGAPVLRVDRLYWAAGGEPVELAVSYFLPEHYSYRVRLRRSRP